MNDALSYFPNLEDVSKYLQIFFDTQSNLLDKDLRITALEFEILLEKQLNRLIDARLAVN